MDVFTTPREKIRHYFTMERFAETSIESILRKPYVKLALNKLRWVPITMGISHYLLPEMPLMDFIIMSTSIEELIHNGNDFSRTAYSRILAVRNILLLLQKAYSFNECVQNYYDLNILQVLNVAREYNLPFKRNLSRLFEEFSLKETDSIKILADTIQRHIEPIIELSECKDSTCRLLSAGSDREQSILSAYELFYIIFHLLFAMVFKEDYSEDVLGKKYHCTDIWNDFELKFINGIREYEEGGD